jgi:hypothetical protein
MKWAVLLTSCVRVKNPDDKRKEYYLRAINDWLEKTNLPIFIVESSNYTFPEFNDTRLKVFSFNLENEPSTSQYEAKSILNAMEYFKNDFTNYTHILKVTARYYLDVEEIIRYVPENSEIILQHCVNHSIQWNNSEIYGFKIGHEQLFLNDIINLGFMETTIYKYALNHIMYRLPPIPNIYNVERGGDRLIINPL